MIFVTEMGDKTQMANLSLVSKSKMPYLVFFSSVLGYSLATLVAVLFGEAVYRRVPQNYIETGSGCLFVIIGILMLTRIF